MSKPQIKANTTRHNVLTYIAVAFSIIWILIIGLEYGNKHPGYYFSFAYFRYTGLFSFFTLFVIASWSLVSNDRFKKFLKYTNGIVLLLVVGLFLMAILLANINYGLEPKSISDILFYFFSSFKTLLILGLFVVLAQSTGMFIARRVFTKYIYNLASLQIALGIITIILILFFLAFFGFLNATNILLLTFLLIVINITFVVQRLKALFLSPIKFDSLSLLGYSSFFITVFFLAINFLNLNVPFPSGFDSRNFYMNISQEIAVSSSLVQGYQPYNWGILMAVGYVLFDNIQLSLGFSFIGIVLIMIPLYEIGIKRLRLEKNMFLFSIALFIVSPAVANQLFVEYKVDFGLLFFQLTTVSVWLLLKSKEPKGEGSYDINYKGYIVLGLLCGFGLGIKLINLFMVFTIGILIWWNGKKKLELLAIVLISTSLIMYAGIDKTSGLSASHLSLGIVKIVCLILGSGLLLYSFYRNKAYVITRMKQSFVFGVFIAIMMSPWMVKNYCDLKSFSVTKLITGENPGPGLNAREIIKNFESKRKNNEE